MFRLIGSCCLSGQKATGFAMSLTQTPLIVPETISSHQPLSQEFMLLFWQGVQGNISEHFVLSDSSSRATLTDLLAFTIQRTFLFSGTSLCVWYFLSHKDIASSKQLAIEQQSRISLDDGIRAELRIRQRRGEK